MVEYKKTKWFFKLRGSFYARSAIIIVRRNDKPSVGKDGVERHWVITLSPDAVNDPKYRAVWASDEEVVPLIECLEQEKM